MPRSAVDNEEPLFEVSVDARESLSIDIPVLVGA
jgi:hypothetical protein